MLLSTMLPRWLGANEAWRFNEKLEEERIDLFGNASISLPVVPEDFRMTLGAPTDYATVLNTVKDLCRERGITLEVLPEPRPELKVPPRVLIEIRRENGTKFRSVIFVTGELVFFTSFTRFV